MNRHQRIVKLAKPPSADSKTPMRKFTKQLLLVIALFATTTIVSRCVLYAQESQRINEAFDRVDGDHNGKLSAAEIERIPQLKTRLSGADTNGDGEVSKVEFQNHMLNLGMRAQSSPLVASGKLTVGDSIRTVKVGDLTRRFLVHVPPKYDGSQAIALVIAFHGGGGNPTSMVQLSGLNEKSNAAGFIVAYPFGSNRDPENGLTYNGGGCCAYAQRNKIDDVGFTAALIDDLIENSSIDKSRVYATGLSNGGIMAHRVGAELSDRIAAIAPVGGPLMLDEFAPKHPVSVMHFHGTKDELAPYAGGKGKGTATAPAFLRPEFASVDSTIAAWVRANGCKTSPITEELPDTVSDGMKSTKVTYSGGSKGSEVILVKVDGGGHTWPGQEPLIELLGPSTKDISANDMMWEFFQQHTR
jgi:poly(3-hydroxybutyrate) depolymerase